MLLSKISVKPMDLSIDRDPSWQNTPREVGDGMESHPEHGANIIPVQTTPQCSKVPSSSSLSNSRACSRSPSPPSSPYSFAYETNQQQTSLFGKKSTLPSRFAGLELPPLTLNNTERCLLEEKSALKDHLQIQIQVNQELKRLLVASVGEDMGFHFERLSTEKAQLSLEVDELKKEIEARKEEMERVEISCDVWRSKFLASRMQCDDLSTNRRSHERQLRELDSAVRGLLREHWYRSEHLDSLYKTLHHINSHVNRDAIVNMQLDDDTFTLAEKCRKLANSLSHKLVGVSVKPASMESVGSVPCATPAEKYVSQLLKEIQQSASKSSRDSSPSTSSQKAYRKPQFERTASRLHFYPGCVNATLNCCPHCKGDIQLV